MRTIWVFDIDSTVANNNARAALLQKRCNVCLYSPCPIGVGNACPNCGGDSFVFSQESWDTFLDTSLIAKDTPIVGAVRVLTLLREQNQDICFLTGRNEGLRQVTESWLLNHAGWQSDKEPLLMRPMEETGLSASIYKERQLQRYLSTLPDKPFLVFFEDDPHVFNVYSKHGLVIRCPEAWQHFAPPGGAGTELAYNR